MPLLGLNGYAYSSGVAVFDGEIRTCVEEERFNREKRTSKFPHGALDAAIADGGLTASDVELVAIPWSPSGLLREGRKAFVGGFPGSLDLLRPSAFSSGRATFPLEAWVRFPHDLRKHLPGLSRKRIAFVPHHQAHAAVAFFSSPFDEAMVVICDGFGDSSALSIWIGRGSSLELVHECPIVDSLGMLYTVVTAHLGYRAWHDEGKVMALAALGSPDAMPEFEEIVRPLPNGGLEFDHSYINFHRAGEARPFTRRFRERFGPARRPDEPLEPRHADLAAAVQRLLETRLMHVVEWFSNELGLKRVALGGGVALNCVANGRMARELGLDEVYVPPNPDDGGTALGAALYAHHCQHGRERMEPLRHAYYGTDVSSEDAAAALAGRPALRVERREEVAASLIAAGRAIGWCQDRMEMGPRALGNRSILADPRVPDMQERLNTSVKHRESYRPYAPAVLREEVAEWFPGSPSSPFMSFASRAAPEVEDRIPAVLHTDATARVQTVDAEASPRFHALISAVARRTGVPIVLNTSLNDREPVCRTAADAVACFDRAGLDALVVADYVLLAPGVELPDEVAALAGSS